MTDQPLDAREREALCAVLEAVGPDAPTLLEGWTAHDLAAHLVLRERDLLAAPCLVLPGPFAHFAARRQARLAAGADLGALVARLRSGPPPGFFRIGWVRSFASLNEFFVHHEDLRRANGLGPRVLAADLEAALWSNATPRGSLPDPPAARCGPGARVGRHRAATPAAGGRTGGGAARRARRAAAPTLRTRRDRRRRRSGRRGGGRDGDALRDVSDRASLGPVATWRPARAGPSSARTTARASAPTWRVRPRARHSRALR